MFICYLPFYEFWTVHNGEFLYHKDDDDDDKEKYGKDDIDMDNHDKEDQY